MQCCVSAFMMGNFMYEVEKGFHNISYCFQNSLPFNVENQPNTLVRVAVIQTVQTKYENFFWSNAVMQSFHKLQLQDIQQNIKGTSVHSQLLSEIIPRNPLVIVVSLKPRLFGSFQKYGLCQCAQHLCLRQYSIVKRAS